MARPRRSHLSELDLQALIDELNEDNDSDYRADSDIEISEDESHSGSPSIDLGESSSRLDLDPQTESERPGPSGDGPDHPDEWTYDMTGTTEPRYAQNTHVSENSKTVDAAIKKGQ
ncbi:hypothetical protein RRG08_018953 [Elysia crispata]|uniref:Uncharacterized protein n=1 Tax=Elysia crispata TaxID=231223 RepID=A0AAE1A621_9GAST|nr:hypothetical protein RRG08_018953 [Elysia crispata]